MTGKKTHFMNEEAAAEINEHHGKPIGREAKSQKAQLNSTHAHGPHKEVKIKMNRKMK